MMIKAKKSKRVMLNKKITMFVVACFYSLVGGLALAQNAPGATESSFSVTPSGTFNYQIPIAVPAGTNGVQPSLSLGFSNNGANGSVGLGWGVSGLSSISRCSQTIARDDINKGAQHSGDDRFCLNGSPLIVTKGAYGAAGSEYRTEIDSFSRIVANGSQSGNVNGGRAPQWFRVFLRDGTYQDFGRDADSRFVLPETQSVDSWRLGRVYDKSDNYYRVRYETSEGLPTVIEYTHNDNVNQQGLNEVRFIYDESREDIRTRYRFGSQITNDKRLSKIDVTRRGVTVRSYNLEYELSPLTKRSRLTSVTECGMNDKCFTPTLISWVQAEPGVLDEATHASDLAPSELITYRFEQNVSTAQSFRSVEVDYGQWIDVNGDGRVDQVRGARDQNGDYAPLTYIQTDDGWTDGTDPDWIIPHPLRSYDLALTSTDLNLLRASVINFGMFDDVNADGLVDIVYSYDYFTDEAQSSESARRTMKKTYLNTGNGWQESPEYEPADILFDYVSNRVGDDGEARTGTTRSVLMDINGDGLPDWVSAYSVYDENGETSEHKSTWLNTGNGWVREPDYDMPDVFVEYNNGFRLEHGEFVDVNGDRLVDWVQGYQRESEDPQIGTWINTGSGWQRNSVYDLPRNEVIFDNERGFTVAASTRRGSFVDVNGDGLSDWVRSYAAGSGTLLTATFLNTGIGWQQNAGYRPPFIHLSQQETFDKNLPMEIRGTYQDVNRDGLVDYVEAYTDQRSDEHRQAWINTGTGWLEDEGTFRPQEILYDYSDTLGNDLATFTPDSRLTVLRQGHFVDINNDGVPDWVNNVRTVFSDINSSGSDESFISTLLAPQHSVEQLATVTTTTGVTIKPTFVPLTSDGDVYTKGENEPELNAQHLIAPIYVVSQLEVSRPDDVELFNTSQYFYEAAQFTRDGRGSLGFKVFRQVNVDQDITNVAEFRQDFPYIGRPARSATIVGDKTINASVNEYDHHVITHSTGESTYFPFVKSTSSYQDELQSDNARLQNQVSEFNYDDFGNVLSTRSVVSDAHDNLLRETTATFVYKAPVINSERWLIGLIDNTRSEISAPNKDLVTNESAFSYDDRGRPMESVREPNQGEELRLTTRLTYDGVGNIMTETLSAGSQADRVTTIEYDDETNTFPTLTTNAKGQSTSIEYHPQCGLPERATDANGLVSTIEYDNFCRQEKSTGPDGVETTTSYLVGTQQCTHCQTKAATVLISNTEGQAPLTMYLNAYGQELMSSTIGLFNEPIVKRTDYDRFGRVERESQPFFETDVQYYTEYEYDRLGRRTLTRLPFFNENGVLATIEQDYSVDQSGRSVLTTRDVKGRVTQSFSDALAQVVEVIDADNKSLKHRYDARSLLIQTIDSKNNTIDIVYDTLGRRISLDDPDLGLTTYAYNAFGELVSQTDAKGQTTTQSYDELGRIVQRVVPEVNGSQSGGISTWSYDVGVNAIGQLSSVTGVNGYAEGYTYDDVGRLSTSTTTVRGEVYEEAYTYNENGQLASKRYPDSGTGNEFSVHYSYVNGYLSLISDRANGLDGCIEHWRANKFDALGRLTQDTLGKVVTTERDYDPAQGVLNSIFSETVTANSDTVQDLSYAFDSVNNLLSRSDQLSSNVETFEYDNLDRLRFYHNGGETTEVRYDELGNITYKSDVGTYSYSGDGGPHAVSRVDLPIDSTNLAQFEVDWEWDGETFLRELPSIHGQNFTYDEVGNTQQSGNRSAYWTAFNKPYLLLSQRASGEQHGSYVEYDAGQQRVYKQEGVYNSTGQLVRVKERTVYIGGGYQRITNEAGELTHRYTIATQGNTIQIDRADGSLFDQPKYLLNNRLGSTSVIINALGEVEQQLAFNPWGMSIDTGSPLSVNALTTTGFTGQEMDDESGLVNMNARIYDPYLGRFLSADPVLPEAYDTQSYNRYSYVVNNPLKYTDPTGNIQQPIEEIVVIGRRPGRSLVGRFFDFFGGLFGGFRPSFNGPPSFDLSFSDEVFRANESFFGADSFFGGSPTFTTVSQFGALTFSSAPFNPVLFLETDGVDNTNLDEIGSAGGGDQFNRGGCANCTTSGSSHSEFFNSSTSLQPGLGGFIDFVRNANGAIAEADQSEDGTGLFDQNEVNDILDIAEGNASAGTLAIASLGLVVSRLPGGKRIKDFFRRDKCFVAGTLVHTNKGTKAIETIEVGDLVASKNDKTGEVEWKPVTQLFENHNKTILNVGFISSLGISETLGTTEEHPFWVKGKGWTNASDLAVGDEITTLKKGVVTVSTIATSTKKQTTYNFEVEDFHTYFVGESAIWVHNSCDPGLDDVVRQLEDRGIEVKNTNVNILGTNGNVLGEVDIVTSNAVLQVKTISSANAVISQVRKRTEPFVTKPVVTFIQDTGKAGNRTVNRAKNKVLITNDIDELAELIK